MDFCCKWSCYQSNLIKKYEYTNVNCYHLESHGMCCIDYKINCQKINDKSETSTGKIQSIKCKMVIFGSHELAEENQFLDSFLELDIKITFDKSFDVEQVSIDDNFDMLKIDIQESMIERNMFKYAKSDERCLDLMDMYCFGYQCVYNDKNEAIIIIVGGCCFRWKKSKDVNDNKKREKELSKSIVFYNTVTHEFKVKPNVKCLFLSRFVSG